MEKSYPQLSKTLTKFSILLSLFSAAILFSSQLLAEQGDDNPTGVSGIYNGNVTTGDNYDPFTGNQMRGPIDDIVVPGSIGAYPLKWTRYFNSRERSWTFSYKDYRISPTTLGFPPTIGFPEGRLINFSRGCVSGVEESASVDPATGKNAIFMADGGKVLFDTYTTCTPPVPPYGGTCTTNYIPVQLIDPYGQVTTIDREIYDHDYLGAPFYRVNRVTEPGGRFLQINWITPQGANISVVGSVQAFDGRGNQTDSVTYAWQSVDSGNAAILTQADYSDQTHAYYDYIAGGGGKVLDWVDDVRHPGPMRQAAFEYVQGDTGGTSILSKEKNYTTGEVVSRRDKNDTPPPHTQQATETRGDGATRTFTYGEKLQFVDADPGNCTANAGKLLNYTDFLGNSTALSYEGTDPDTDPHFGFINAVTDPNSHTTQYERQTNSWGIKTITHSDGSTIRQTFNPTRGLDAESAPWYLASRKDENNNTTIYTRDGQMRITRKDYPDDGWEEFDYNNFGEVTAHRRCKDGTNV